jgi:NaMN:DMB phosphoribosyltransferase
VLRALGYQAGVSSSFQSNPTALKEEVVARALARAGIKEGELKNQPLRAVQEVGDPMMPAALGLMQGLNGCRTVLAGGTQMAAVLALAKALDMQGDISIATTKYIVEDRTAGFKEIVEEAGRPYYYADPGLEKSSIPPVQIYAQGYVKEGVGMGGASLLAGIYGVSQRQLVEETDRVLLTVELPKR